MQVTWLKRRRWIERPINHRASIAWTYGPLIRDRARVFKAEL